MTYSIVARDGETGELGVAVQSHYFQVGPVVPWALAGVGAVATQSMVNVSFGPLGLDYMGAGYSAQQALKALLAGDAQPEVRQVALVDATGNVAAHTGARCIPAAGHRTGDGLSCQANLMEKDSVWDAMYEAYVSDQGRLPSACSRPSTQPRRKAATSAAANRRRCWWYPASPPGIRGNTASSTYASRMRPIRSPSCAGFFASSAPTKPTPWPIGSRTAAINRRRCRNGRRRWRSRRSWWSCVSGPASAWPTWGSSKRAAA